MSLCSSYSCLSLSPVPGPRCTKLTIDGNFAINGNYHGNLYFDWLLSPVTMVVAIDGKVTINGKIYATGPQVCLNLIPFSFPSPFPEPPPPLPILISSFPLFAFHLSSVRKEKKHLYLFAFICFNCTFSAVMK